MTLPSEEVKVLNIELQSGPCEQTSAIINQWLSQGWKLHTILNSPFKIQTIEMPTLTVILVKEATP
jgi:23S rRNA C2498 (ribose-2'-O)-methylase RlmM